MLQLDLSDMNLTPREVVERLDKHIVGQVRSLTCLAVTVKPHFADQAKDCQVDLPLQSDAKRAVANALRNRWRRHKIASPMKVRPCNALPACLCMIWLGILQEVAQCVMHDCCGTARWVLRWLASPNNVLHYLVTALHATLHCTLFCSLATTTVRPCSIAFGELFKGRWHWLLPF